MDTNTCCYLGLTCRLFSVIISGAGEGPAAGSFRDLMKLLIQVRVHFLLTAAGGDTCDSSEIEEMFFISNVLRNMFIRLSGGRTSTSLS